MFTSLILLGIGALLGGAAAIIVGWRWMRNYYEYEAYSSYLVGFASGKSQEKFDAKRRGVVWTRVS